MTLRYRTNGIVFKKENQGENDILFTLFTDSYGKLEVLSRASRKIKSKLKYGIDSLCLSQVEFIEGKNQKTLTDANSIKKFENIITDTDKASVAGDICRLLDTFLGGEESDKRIFLLIKETFEFLNDCNNPLPVYQYFFWNFISAMGYMPETWETKKISADVLEIIKIMLSGNKEILQKSKIGKETIMQMEKISQEYYFSLASIYSFKLIKKYE